MSISVIGVEMLGLLSGVSQDKRKLMLRDLAICCSTSDEITTLLLREGMKEKIIEVEKFGDAEEKRLSRIVLSLCNVDLVQEQIQVQLQDQNNQLQQQMQQMQDRIQQLEGNVRSAKKEAWIAEKEQKDAEIKLKELTDKLSDPHSCTICKQMSETLSNSGKNYSDHELIEFNKQKEEIYRIIRDAFKGKRDNSGRRDAIESGLLSGLLNVIKNEKLKDITRLFTTALNSLTVPCSDEIKLLICEKNPMADLIRLLSHDDDIIVQDGIATIFNLLFAGASKDTLRAPHPLFDEMQRIGGINQFAKIFRSGTPKAKCISALCIAHLYRGKKMDNTQLNKQIIEQVMDLSEKKPDHWAFKAAQLVMEEIEAL